MEGRDQGLEGLLVIVATGDERAFAHLYDQISGPVYGLILRVVRDPAQSEEVMQEVMLEVWRSATRFDRRKGSAASWVLTIAHRRAVDRVRTAAAATARERRLHEPASGADDVADRVQAALDAELVRNCLDGLTDVQREAIMLAYYGGCSYRQVSEMLGVTLGTVKTRIRDGLIRLRDCMGVTLCGRPAPTITC